MSEDNTYRTSDTTLAAFLVTAQYTLLYVDYEQSARFEFVFPESNEIRESANKYISGNALINPSSFARVNRKLLRIIHKRCQWEED